MKRWIVIAMLLGLPFAGLHAQEPEATNSTAAVIFHGKELFEVPGISSISAEDRVEVFNRRFKRAAKSPLVNTEHFTLHHDDELKISVIMLDGEVMVAVWESDAEYHGVPREKLAEHWMETLHEVIDQLDNFIAGESFRKEFGKLLLPAEFEKYSE